MWSHFLNLIGRSWNSMVRATSTNTFGFFLWTVALTAVSWGATLSGTWFKLKREQIEQHPLAKALQNSIWPGVFLAVGFFLLVMFAWSFFTAKAIYNDHTLLVFDTANLRSENGRLSGELEDRKHSIHIEDPAYGHIKVLFAAFVSFRRAIGDRTPCEVRISAPTDSNGPSDPIIRQVADIAALASGCGVFGPGDAKMDPDVKREAMTGMKAGFIVMHTQKDQAGSLAFYDALAPYVPLTRSYDDMPHPVQRGASAVPTLIWFQFGTDVHWIR